VIKQCFFPRLAAVVAHLISFVLFRAGAAKVVSKMASQFATVGEEQILALNEGAVTENTKKATNLACCFLQLRFFLMVCIYYKQYFPQCWWLRSSVSIHH